MFIKKFKHKILSSTNNVTVLGLDKNIQALYVWNLFCVSKKSIIVVTDTLYEANNLYNDFTNQSDVLFFPMDDFLVSETLAISPDLMAKRIETLDELSKTNNKKIIITNLMGYLRFEPSIKLWKTLSTPININNDIKRSELIEKLNQLGYKKENIVTKTGEYANRGYILDIFIYGYDNPIRIEFFDNVVEQIRIFDPDTQISKESLDKIIITPFTEFINEKNIDNIPKRQSLLPRVVNIVSKIDDYLYNYLTAFVDLERIKLSYKNILNESFEFQQTDQFHIKEYMHDLYKVIPNQYLNFTLLDNVIENTKDNVIEKYNSYSIDKFNGNYSKINAFLKEQLNKKNKIIVCLSKTEIINEFIDNINLKYVITNYENIYDNTINIIKVKMNSGFTIENEIYLTEHELFGKNIVHNYKTKFKYGSKINDINKLNIGDYVVHSEYGIGKYLGIVTLKSKGLVKDYLHIQYKNNDKLYIPVEKIELISKYSSNEGAIPLLSKLGGTDWSRLKARARTKTLDIAKKLLDMSVKRKMTLGFSFYKDDTEQIKFINDFEHVETKDQAKSYQEIKQDMESSIPMDRLLCGDVGYGKTEVAFRAIYKAIKSGKQAAFLCPTTILSNQHYNNAKLRFNGYGVNIAVLNRFISDKEKKQIINDLKTGKIDLIIGTHRLLSKDIEFKDLGLLVIDEEQRFGVTHKEKIKEYKSNIDVLTLSATPIPRTLQMSLTGLRGLSLIETPPVDRYPVQTYVLKENSQIIKDAIYKELSRNGQIFILYNSVTKIETELNKIQKLVPEAKITYIHGQMNKSQIENTMEDFVNKKYDILICTTIIETGIDIQNANTLIVIDADHFGLSQLYQIRGRIGRGSNIGYAYLMYNPNKELNEIAVKRLNAIKEFTELGSGYALAARDLSIRGAGDILGSEQSGFIDSIGYDMYLKILNEEVNKLKGEQIIEQQEKDEKPYIQVSTHISDFYADSEELKIEVHKKINEIDSYTSFETIKKELTDRFGNLSNDIIIYMLEELFQSQAKKKQVVRVEQQANKIITIFSKEKSETINIKDFMVTLFHITPNFDLNYDNKILKITLNTQNLDHHFLYYLLKMLENIE